VVKLLLAHIIPLRCEVLFRSLSRASCALRLASTILLRRPRREWAPDIDKQTRHL